MRPPGESEQREPRYADTGAPESRTLRTQAASGVRWTGVSALVITVFQYGQLLVLARILSPADFGLMAMTVVVLSFAYAYADMGISNAIIWRQETTKRQLSSLYWLNVFAGLAIAGLIVAARPLIIRFYGEPRLEPLLLLAALLFVITPFGQQFTVLLEKTLRFRLLALIEMTAAACGVAVAVASALLGVGAAALMLGPLAAAAVRVILLHATAGREGRPQLHFSPKDLSGFMRFGLYQVGERSINVLASNIDYLLIGRFLGSQALGFYSIAYQLVIVPVARINPILTRVAFPVFARRQDDDAALRRGYLELIGATAFVAFPFLIGIAVSARVLVPALYGSKWMLSAALLQIMVPIGICKALDNPSGSVLLAKGRADVGFKWNLFEIAVIAAAIYAAVPSGLMAVAWAYAGVVIGFFLLYRFVLKAVFGLGWGEFFARLKLPFLAATATGVLLYVTSRLLTGRGVGELVSLLILVALGVAVYIPIWYLLDKGYVTHLRSLLLGRPAGVNGG
jgi:O-antigen/teichoic acid export membrane protein